MLAKCSDLCCMIFLDTSCLCVCLSFHVTTPGSFIQPPPRSVLTPMLNLSLVVSSTRQKRWIINWSNTLKASTFDHFFCTGRGLNWSMSLCLTVKLHVLFIWIDFCFIFFSSYVSIWLIFFFFFLLFIFFIRQKDKDPSRFKKNLPKCKMTHGWPLLLVMDIKRSIHQRLGPRAVVCCYLY